MAKGFSIITPAFGQRLSKDVRQRQQKENGAKGNGRSDEQPFYQHGFVRAALRLFCAGPAKDGGGHGLNASVCWNSGPREIRITNSESRMNPENRRGTPRRI